MVRDWSEAHAWLQRAASADLTAAHGGTIRARLVACRGAHPVLGAVCRPFGTGTPRPAIAELLTLAGMLCADGVAASFGVTTRSPATAGDERDALLVVSADATATAVVRSTLRYYRAGPTGPDWQPPIVDTQPDGWLPAALARTVRAPAGQPSGDVSTQTRRCVALGHRIVVPSIRAIDDPFDSAG